MTDSPRRHPAFSIFLILLVVFLGFIVIGPMFGVLAALPFFPGSLTDLVTFISNFTDQPEMKLPLYVIQGFATGIGLLAVPMLYAKFADGSLFKRTVYSQPSVQHGILTVAVVLSFIVVNSVFIEWNASLHLPSFLKGFEEWARSREDYAEELTAYLTEFDSPALFATALVVIAFLPALGEEYVFRGLLQNEFLRWTGNTHAAVWISAVLFSSFHMQFFGFVPRLFLGALFGYLCSWSGNLSLPILAHFVNNGFGLVMMYLNQLGYIDIDVESTEAEPWPLVLLFATITTLLLYRLHRIVRPVHPPAS